MTRFPGKLISWLPSSQAWLLSLPPASQLLAWLLFWLPSWGLSWLLALQFSFPSLLLVSWLLVPSWLLASYPCLEVCSNPRLCLSPLPFSESLQQHHASGKDAIV